MTDFSRIVENSRADSANKEFRLQPDSKKAGKKQLYTHSRTNLFKNLMEMFGLYKGRRAEKRQAGANHISAAIDRHYGIDGFGETVFSDLKKSGQYEHRDIRTHVLEGDMVHLKDAGDRLLKQRNTKFVIDYCKESNGIGGQDENDNALSFIKYDLRANGTDNHPAETHQRTWTLIARRLRKDVEMLQAGRDLKQCSKFFQNIVAHVVSTSKVGLDRDSFEQGVRSYFDNPKTWSRVVCQANLSTLRDFLLPLEDAKDVAHSADDATNEPSTNFFAKDGKYWQQLYDNTIGRLFRTEPEDSGDNRIAKHYIGNVVGLVDEWHEKMANKGGADPISSEDKEWLKNELSRLLDDELKPPQQWQDGTHLNEDTLVDFCNNTMRTFDKCRKVLMISEGSESKRLRQAVGFVKNAKEVTRDDIIGWHDSCFRELIDLRRAAQAKLAAGRNERSLQRKLRAFPELKTFAKSAAKRGLHENLAFGKTDSAGEFVNIWMNETGLSEVLHNKFGIDETDNLTTTLQVLDDHAKFIGDVNKMAKMHGRPSNHPATAAELRDLVEITKRADALAEQADALEALAERIGACDIDDADGGTAQLHLALGQAVQRIRSDIKHYTGSARRQEYQGREAQFMLMQLPNIQNLRNELVSNTDPAMHFEKPSNVVARTMDDEFNEAPKGFADWNQAVRALDNYADFVNLKGPRLAELERRTRGDHKLNKTEQDELKTLRNDLRALDKDIAQLSKANAELREGIGEFPTTTTKRILDAVDRSVALMTKRLHGGAKGASSRDSSFNVGTFVSNLLGLSDNLENETRTFIQGPSAVPISKPALADNLKAVRTVADAFAYQRLPNDPEEVVSMAAVRLSQLNTSFTESMRNDPLAKARDDKFQKDCEQFTKAGQDLEKLFRRLDRLRQAVVKANNMPTAEHPGVWPGTNKGGLPTDHGERRALYLSTIDRLKDQLAPLADAYASRVNDLVAYWTAGD